VISVAGLYGSTNLLALTGDELGKHAISGAAADLIKTIPGLAKALEEAQLYATEPDKHGDRNVLAIEKYKVELSLSGVNLNVLITVKRYLDGRRYYDHGFVAKKTHR
jgi:hypothetical protein